MNRILDYLAELLRGKLEEVIIEVSEDILSMVGEDESIVQAWLETLTPLKRMVAEHLLNLIEELLAIVVDKVEKDEPAA